MRGLLRVCVARASIAILLLAAGCSSDGRSRVAANETLRVAFNIEPRSLNPIFNDEVGATQELNNLYNDRLWVRDAHGVLIGQLAQRVPSVANKDISADGRTLIVRLRHDVKWQDGVPLTSADVLFSWRAVMNPANNVGSLEGYEQITAIETPDRYTAVVHLRRRYARAAPHAFPDLIPEHLLRGVALNSAAFNAAPIGSGPYRVVSWKRGDSVELVANDAYYLGKPKIARIRAVFVPSAQTRAIMLETGELDLAELDRDSYRQIAGAANVAFSIDPNRSDTLLFLNVTRPNLSDVRVRRAISLSIDRNALAKVTAFRGYTVTPANGYADPLSFAYDSARAPAPYDPAAAARLLDAAQWRRGAGGVRFRDGHPLTVELIARAGASEQIALTTRLQAMLRAAGFDAQIKTVASELLFAPAAEHGVLADGAYDLLIETYGNFADPDPSWILTCARVEPKGYNESRYCNPALDRLAQQGLDSYDPAVRKAKYAAIERVVATDVPIAYLFWSKSIYGMNPRLRGFSYDGQSATWNAGSWSLAYKKLARGIEGPL